MGHIHRKQPPRPWDHVYRMRLTCRLSILPNHSSYLQNLQLASTMYMLKRLAGMLGLPATRAGTFCSRIGPGYGVDQHDGFHTFYYV